eukprot:EG_transcript_36882
MVRSLVFVILFAVAMGQPGDPPPGASLCVWGDWAPCDCPAGLRSRGVYPVDPAGTCLRAVESRPCEPGECPDACEWGDWSACVGRCGAASRSRGHVPAGGAACTMEAQLEPCEPPQCSGDCTPVACLVNPCSVSRCDAHPAATCQADYCHGCTARWSLPAGEPVDCAE